MKIKPKRIKEIIAESIAAKTAILYDDNLLRLILNAAVAIEKTIKRGGKVLIFGNGGSAADSQHFAAELTGRFQKERAGLPAIALTTDTSSITALANDYSFDIIFKRQLEALAQPKDIVVAISTSGKAKNVIEAVKAAKKIGLNTIGLTGHSGSELSKITDISIVVPSNVTARIQEVHILIIHIICELVESSF